MTRPSTHIHGAGRAGRSLFGALTEAGWNVRLTGRGDDVSRALQALEEGGSDIVVLAVSDGAIAEVAASIEPGPGLVAHLSGSRTLDVLAPHDRRASLHPLMSLPNPEIGARRLADQCHFAVCGDAAIRSIVDALDGIGFDVADDDRATYHAAASVAANHLVTICAQVERLAGSIGVPTAAFWTMVATTVDNVTAIGPNAALTGPASRADWATIEAHLASIPSAERDLYRAVARATAELAGNDWPTELS